MTDYKERILQDLDVLRRTSASDPAGVFKVRQYALAIRTLQALPAIRTMDDISGVAGPGIGPKIRAKIQEIIETGKLASADRARETKAPESLDAFHKIFGVGPKKAEEWVKKGYRTIEALREAIQKDPDFCTKNQKIGLRYYEALQQRIPREEMDKHNLFLRANLPSSYEDLFFEMVGSYRRGKHDSGDIDTILCAKQPKVLSEFVSILRQKGYIQEVLAQGGSKCLAICALPGETPRRLDLLYTTPEEFPFAVLYFTGSDEFNKRMRAHALTKGCTLNEHALTHLATGKQVQGCKTEDAIFRALCFPWIEPEHRIA
jgi:DNA polymerase beta